MHVSEAYVLRASDNTRPKAEPPAHMCFVFSAMRGNGLDIARNKAARYNEVLCRRTGAVQLTCKHAKYGSAPVEL